MSDEPPPDPIDDAIVNLLDRYAPEYSCPICKSDDWEVTSGGFLPMARVVRKAGRFLPRAPFGQMPLGVVSCTTCGYSYFINLFLARAVPK